MNDNLQPLNDLSSKAFDKLFARYQNLNTDVLLVYLVDSVNSTALIHLAEQFHITGNEGWLNCTTDSERRDLIKNAISLHKYRGTKFALIKVLEVLGLDGHIEEWFEYAGDPYYFRLEVSMKDKGYLPETENLLLELINENKNVRSKLEKLFVYLISTASQAFASHMITSEEVIV